ncbi:hypothetical protein ACFRMN_36200 [Streptomyces sp. NPDC056835]
MLSVPAAAPATRPVTFVARKAPGAVGRRRQIHQLTDQAGQAAPLGQA